MLLILTSHLDAVHQQGHQLGYSLRLRNSYQDFTLLQQFDLKSDPSLFLKNLTEIFIIWDPIPFNEFIFHEKDIVCGALVGIGG